MASEENKTIEKVVEELDEMSVNENERLEAYKRKLAIWDYNVSIAEANDKGIAQYKGLGAGTYYVKETKAPTGYVLDSTIHEIKIGPNGTLEAADTEGYYRLEVSNHKAGLLPVTGSVGTIIFVVLGLAIIGIAVYFFGFYKKNKKQEEQAI